MSNALEKLKAQITELRNVDSDIESLSEQLALLTAEKTKLETEVLPALFAEAGITQLKTEDGATVKVGLVAAGSLPKEAEARAAAIKWLSENGYNEVIEAKVVASWARGDKAKAEALYNQLRGDNSVKLALEEGVNHMTLGALAKKRVQSGEEIPLGTLGISVISRARFTSK